jgi:hypothetical protein
MATVVKLIDGTVHEGRQARPRAHLLGRDPLPGRDRQGTRNSMSPGRRCRRGVGLEGTVAVQSAGGNRAVDVTPGRTAVASATDDDATPDLEATPAGGAPEAAKAAGKSAKDKAGKTSADGSEDGNSKSNGVSLRPRPPVAVEA